MDIKCKDGKTIITIDNSLDLRDSSSGKMELLDTTGGFAMTEGKVADGRTIRVNCTVGVTK